MTPDQIAKLLEVLERIASRQYTLTGASDWPILMAVGGVLVALIGLMWSDLRSSIKEYRTDWKSELAVHKRESKEELDLVWSALRDCQNDCCPRGAASRGAWKRPTRENANDS